MISARPAQQDADDYESILAAVMETARGRWFVAEFARRNRQVETEKVLDALTRIERRIAGGPSADALHPDLADLAAIFALRDIADTPRDGLTSDIVSEIAREIGDHSEAIRDHLLKARGALKGLTESGGDERLCTAIDQVMIDVDRLSVGQGDAGRRIEALAQVIGTIRDRLRRLIESGEKKRDIDPWIVTPEAEPEREEMFRAAAETTAIQPMAETPVATPVAPEEPILFADEPAPMAAPAAFQGGLPIEPVAPGARLRLAIADEEHNLRDLPPIPVKPPRRTASGGPRTAADLDRLGYSERYALFAS